MVNCGLIFNIALILAAQVGFHLGLPKSLHPINMETKVEHRPIQPTSRVTQVAINLTDINQLATAPIDDPARVWALQLELMAIAEALFGPRDLSYQLYQPQFYENGPNVRFSLDQQAVWAELSFNGRLYWPTVVYELAHETVHLLNPGVLGTANYLEEGVAVAFSLHAQTLYGLDVQNTQTPKLPSYVYAIQLLDALPGDILADAALIRREVGQFSRITAEDLLELYPDLDPRIAYALTRKFDRDANPYEPVAGGS